MFNKKYKLDRTIKEPFDTVIVHKVREQIQENQNQSD